MVLNRDLGGAESPVLNITRDMKGLSDITATVVANDWGTESAWWEAGAALKGLVLEKEWGVVHGGESFLSS